MPIAQFPIDMTKQNGTRLLQQHVFLIGFRGAGKTSVARLLAELLSVSWIDCDDEIERRTAQTIAAIFAEDGEDAFRRLESDVLAELSHRSPHIVATGGGAVLRDVNRKLMHDTGHVVWLRVTAEDALDRIVADPTSRHRRPNLRGSGDLNEIQELLLERDPIYGVSAHLAVDTQGRTADDVAREIVARLGL